MSWTRTTVIITLAFSLLYACANEPTRKTFKEQITECENIIYALDIEISAAHETFLQAVKNTPTYQQQKMASDYSSSVIPALIKAESKSREAASDIANLTSKIQKDSTYSEPQKKWFSSFLGYMANVYSFRAEYYSTTLLATKNVGGNVKLVKTLLGEAEGKRGASEAHRVMAVMLLSAIKNPAAAKSESDQK